MIDFLTLVAPIIFEDQFTIGVRDLCETAIQAIELLVTGARGG